MLCLLAVAFVAALHLCKSVGGIYSTNAAVAVALDDNGTSEGRPVVIEACHVCATVTVAELSVTGCPDKGPVPSLRVAPLVAFQPKTVGPPPKT